MLGVTDRQLGDFFGVSEQTINTWKKEHPKFLESIKAGKNIADANVAESLYHRAIGYSHPDEKIFNSGGEVLRVETTKHYSPDTQAGSLWLRNRQPAIWRDKKGFHVKDERPLKDVPTEELKQMARDSYKALGLDDIDED